jgi:hypothetical protein
MERIRFRRHRITTAVRAFLGQRPLRVIPMVIITTRRRIITNRRRIIRRHTKARTTQNPKPQRSDPPRVAMQALVAITTEDSYSAVPLPRALSKYSAD